MHLTGLYQPWFDGVKVPDSGHIYIVMGQTIDSTSDVLQKALIGTADASMLDDYGSGSIPRKCIDFESIRKNGRHLEIIRIKHKDGGYNTLYFIAASKGTSPIMGMTVKGVLIDEEPEFNSLAMYSQLLTRTMTTNGFITLTFTPEFGLTALNKLFEEDKTGQLYLQSAGWADAPHLTPEMIEKMKAGIPDFELPMRMHGIPCQGAGSVFPFPDDAVKIPDVTPSDNWVIIAGIDFGLVSDPSVVVFAAHDPESDKFYLLSEKYLNEDRSPKAIADYIKSSKYPNIKVITPRDGGVNSENANDTKAKLLIQYGLNVIPWGFRNPTNETSLSIKYVTAQGRGGASIQAGLTLMNTLQQEGKLKVCASCEKWFEEKHSYMYQQKASGAFKPHGDDHVIDASRYALMTLLDGQGSTVLEAKGFTERRSQDEYLTSLFGE